MRDLNTMASLWLIFDVVIQHPIMKLNIGLDDDLVSN